MVKFREDVDSKPNTAKHDTYPALTLALLFFPPEIKKGTELTKKN